MTGFCGTTSIVTFCGILGSTNFSTLPRHVQLVSGCVVAGAGPLFMAECDLVRDSQNSLCDFYSERLPVLIQPAKLV